MNLIDKHGYLTIPLYHGTSSIFIESIINNGLGAISQNTNYDIELFTKICSAHRKSDWQSDWWKENSYTWESMLNQKTGKFSNFRYGGTYLSPSRENASGYALNNSHGSELLSTIIDALKNLEKFDLKYAYKLIPKNHWIRSVILLEHKPVLITIHRIKIADLKTEKDQSVFDLLEEMSSLLEQLPEIATDILWSQNNFHTITPLSITARDIEYLT